MELVFTGMLSELCSVRNSDHFTEKLKLPDIFNYFPKTQRQTLRFYLITQKISLYKDNNRLDSLEITIGSHFNQFHMILKMNSDPMEKTKQKKY